MPWLLLAWLLASPMVLELIICSIWTLCQTKEGSSTTCAIAALKMIKYANVSWTKCNRTRVQVCSCSAVVMLLVIFHPMMTSSNENIFRVTGHLCGEFTGPGEFPALRPVTRSFEGIFDLRPNKRLSKQPWGWWFDTPSWSLWRQCNACDIMVIAPSGLIFNQIRFRISIPFEATVSRPLTSRSQPTNGCMSIKWRISNSLIVCPCLPCLNSTCANSRVNKGPMDRVI